MLTKYVRRWAIFKESALGRFSKIVSVLRSASVERFFVSRIQDFCLSIINTASIFVFICLGPKGLSILKYLLLLLRRCYCFLLTICDRLPQGSYLMCALKSRVHQSNRGSRPVKKLLILVFVQRRGGRSNPSLTFSKVGGLGAGWLTQIQALLRHCSA